MSKHRRNKSEPFIKIGAGILDSDAYKDLGFSARSMLNELLFYYNGNNNGHIYMSKKVLQERGFSKNTATAALKELLSHGFIYMTKKGGNVSGSCSWYALTWLPIKTRLDGQNLNNFVRNAYEKWQKTPKNKKKCRSKFGLVQDQNLGFEVALNEDKRSDFHLNHRVRSGEQVLSNPIICDL